MRAGPGASQAASTRRPPGPITFAAFSSHLRGAMGPSGLMLIIGVLAAAPLVSAQEVVPGDSTSTAASRAAAWYTRPAAGVEVGYSRTDLALGGGGNLLTSRQGAITGAYLQFPLHDDLRDPPRAALQPQGRKHRRHDRGGSKSQHRHRAGLHRAARAVPGIVPHRQHPSGALRRARPGDPDRVRFQLHRDATVPVHLWAGQSDQRSGAGTSGWWREAGWRSVLRRATIALEARYTAGTRSILEDVELKNRAFGLVLAVTF